MDRKRDWYSDFMLDYLEFTAGKIEIRVNQINRYASENLTDQYSGFILDYMELTV